MPSSQYTYSLDGEDFPDDDSLDDNEREAVVLSFIEMSIEALHYLESDKEAGKQNQALWLASRATVHSESLPGIFQKKAYIQSAYCHYAESKWRSAAIMLDLAKTKGKDAWTPEDEEFLSECLKLADDEDATRPFSAIGGY